MIKFAIWGCGIRGKMLLDLLGKENVECFIDNNETYIDTAYKGVPVFTYSQYRNKQTEHFIIITPWGKETEIRRQMEMDDRQKSFPLGQEIGTLRELLCEFGLEKIADMIPDNGNIFLYGETILNILILDFLREKGRSIKGIISDDKNSEKAMYFDNMLKVKTYSMACLNQEDCVVLTTALKDNDRKIVEENGVSVLSLYDVCRDRERFYNEGIEQFKNKHCGERCFIVATGPSLKMEDLETLRINGEICISVNGILKAFDKTKWRPDYYIVSDPFCTYTWKNEIIKMEVQYKFIADYAWNFGDLDIPNFFKFHLLREGNNQPGFSPDFARYSCHGNTVVYDGALQLAAYMGFGEIYLLGVDCNLHKETKHFIEGYACNKFDDNDQVFVLNAYRAAEKYSRENNFRIYNATRGGELEIFERVDFDGLFE